MSIRSHSQSQPLLGVEIYNDDTDGSSSSGELRGGNDSSAQTRRLRSDGDVPPAGAGIIRSLKSRHGDEDEGRDEQTDAYSQSQMCKAYVSFEDVIDTTMLWDNSVWPPEAGISDPLLRTASRLYAREVIGKPQHHHRQPSPGPLGTRRGSAMHKLVKKYVHPLLGFLAGVFCCAIPRDQLANQAVV